MTTHFTCAQPRHYAPLGIAFLFIELTVALASAQTLESANPIQQECVALNMNSVSGQQTDAEFEVQARRMLARVGDSGEYNFCKGMTLSYLALSLLAQDKLDGAKQAAEASLKLLEPVIVIPAGLGGTKDGLLRQSIGVLASAAISRNNFDEAARQAARLHPLAATEKTLALESGLWMSIAIHRNQLNVAVQYGKETIAHWDKAGIRAVDPMENDLIDLGVALVMSGRPTEAIPFVNRAIDMSGEMRAFGAQAKANALMGFSQWQAGHGSNTADRCFKTALYWLDQVPQQERAQPGRQVYATYLSYLNATGRRREAKIVRAKLDSFGADPNQWLVDYTDSRPSNHE